MVSVELTAHNLMDVHSPSHLNVQMAHVSTSTENALVKVIVSMTYRSNVLIRPVLLPSLSVEED